MGFGARLKELRTSKKIPQSVIAGHLGITNQAYSLYELDKREPDYETLLKIANYFNVSVDYLLGKTDVKNDDEKSTVTDDDIKFALFGEVADKIPDEKLQEVKNFAQFIKDNFKKG